jgi:hypothetical protein
MEVGQGRARGTERSVLEGRAFSFHSALFALEGGSMERELGGLANPDQSMPALGDIFRVICLGSDCWRCFLSFFLFWLRNAGVGWFFCALKGGGYERGSGIQEREMA